MQALVHLLRCSVCQVYCVIYLATMTYQHINMLLYYLIFDVQLLIFLKRSGSQYRLIVEVVAMSSIIVAQ